MGKLDDKTAVITGGSRGLGLTTAQRFVQEGAHVFVMGRDEAALKTATEQIGRNVTGVRGDASDLADLDRLYQAVERERGSIDVLFANAGVGEPAHLGQITEEHFDRTFGLNTRGTVFTVQKALPLLNDGASVVLTASIASVMAWEGWSVYAASRAALLAMARSWLNELCARRIRVNVMSLGQVATPIQQELWDDDMRRHFESLIPRGEMGRPEEIAATALFLAGPDSSYVNGVELTVDGGMSSIGLSPLS